MPVEPDSGALLPVVVVVGGLTILGGLGLLALSLQRRRPGGAPMGLAAAAAAVVVAVITIVAVTGFGVTHDAEPSPAPTVVPGSGTVPDVSSSLAGDSPGRDTDSTATRSATASRADTSRPASAATARSLKSTARPAAVRAPKITTPAVDPIATKTVTVFAPASSIRTVARPAAAPVGGTVSQVTIPGTVSGLDARPAWIYLPPAYTAANKPKLPLLLLIAGEPGGPGDWFAGGHVQQVMDTYAADHHGVAPIVVVPDPTGSRTGNTMCANSKLGNAATYILTDVVGWIRGHLRVDPHTAHWAIGGFSFGATCALQFAVARPQLFPTFLDISGETAPTLGTPAQSVNVAFGGNEAAYQAIQPLWIMAQDAKSPAKAALLRTLDGTFSVGTQDPRYAAMQRVVVAACRGAGITVHASLYPGRHLWVDARAAFVTALPHLMARMGLS